MRLDRSYFALQARFATRIAEIDGIPFDEACRLHTAFYALARDNDAGVAAERNDFDPRHADWLAFVEAVDRGEDPVDYVYAAYLAGDAQEDDEAVCFTYTYWAQDRLVRIHFSNNRDGTALRMSSVADRRRELHTIFAAIASEHSDAAVVRGTSWLYHLEGYRRLFPAAFVADLHSVGHPHQFAALWAQFIDRHGVVKRSLAEEFLAAIDKATTAAELDAAFPLDVLAATGEIAIFYDDLGSTRAEGRAPLVSRGEREPVRRRNFRGLPPGSRSGSWRLGFRHPLPSLPSRPRDPGGR